VSEKLQLSAPVTPISDTEYYQLLSRRTVEKVLGRIIFQYLGLIKIAARRWLPTVRIESLNVGNPTKQAITCRGFSR
jgi:hypothetical protein